MLSTIIVIFIIVVTAFLWVRSTKRKIVALVEDINNTMNQISVQLSSRFDALTTLLDLTKGYAKQESEMLIGTIKSSRSAITVKSTPDDVYWQEGIISETLSGIVMMSDQYPELIADLNYKKAMNAVETFENMIRTSRLVYNHSVTKLNREIRIFPVSIIGRILGFHQKDYLEEYAGKRKF